MTPEEFHKKMEEAKKQFPNHIQELKKLEEVYDVIEGMKNRLEGVKKKNFKESEEEFEGLIPKDLLPKGKSISRKDEMRLLEQLRDQMKSEVLERQDSRDKHIGDRVKIWDFSGCVNENNEEPDATEYQKLEGIVCEEGLKHEFKTVIKNPFGGKGPEFKYTYVLDLRVVYPNGKKFYTRSDFVKRLDKQLA